MTRIAIRVDDRERASSVYGLLGTAPDFDVTVTRLKLGDYLLTVGGLDTADPTFPDRFNAKYGSTPPGLTIPVEIRRGTQRMTLNAPAKFNTIEGRRLIEMTNAPPKAIRVRDGLLNGTLQQ